VKARPRNFTIGTAPILWLSADQLSHSHENAIHPVRFSLDRACGPALLSTFLSRPTLTWIILHADCCPVLQASLFLPLAFPVPPLLRSVPPIKQLFALEAEATRFRVPQENGARKSRKFSYVWFVLRWPLPKRRPATLEAARLGRSGGNGQLRGTKELDLS
jgi:hypothetical protein